MRLLILGGTQFLGRAIDQIVGWYDAVEAVLIA